MRTKKIQNNNLEINVHISKEDKEFLAFQKEIGYNKNLIIYTAFRELTKCDDETVFSTNLISPKQLNEDCKYGNIIKFKDAEVYEKFLILKNKYKNLTYRELYLIGLSLIEKRKTLYLMFDMD